MRRTVDCLSPATTTLRSCHCERSLGSASAPRPACASDSRVRRTHIPSAVASNVYSDLTVPRWRRQPSFPPFPALKHLLGARRAGRQIPSLAPQLQNKLERRQLWTAGVERKVRGIVDEHDWLLQRQTTESASISSEDLRAINKRVSELETVVQQFEELESKQKALEQLSPLLADSDQGIRDLAAEDAAQLHEQLEILKRGMLEALVPADQADTGNAMVELRAGTGGDEASLFVADVLRMYERYAQIQGWTFEVLATSPSGAKGLKDALVSISGEDVFRKMKYESGVHRVQRVPETETSGRVHTSTVTVAVLPEPKEVDISIPPSHLRIETMRASGAGGQSVNTTDSAVRITHIPTGLSVHISDERSQHKNRAKALRILHARIYDLERSKVDAERKATRRGMVGGAGRSEKVRTYNWGRARVTEHKLKGLGEAGEGATVDLWRCLC